MQLEDPRIRYRQLQNERTSTESIPMQTASQVSFFLSPKCVQNLFFFRIASVPIFGICDVSTRCDCDIVRNLWYRSRIHKIDNETRSILIYIPYVKTPPLRRRTQSPRILREKIMNYPNDLQHNQNQSICPFSLVSCVLLASAWLSISRISDKPSTSISSIPRTKCSNIIS